MRTSFTRILACGLLLWIAGCGPAATQPPVADSPAPAAAPAATEAGAPSPSAVLPEATATLLPTATPFPVATSRGPNLEATDPRTVNLASGQLQLVEFFRFT